MRFHAFIGGVLLLAGASCSSDASDPAASPVESAIVDESTVAPETTAEEGSPASTTAVVTSTAATPQEPGGTSRVTVSEPAGVSEAQGEVGAGEVRLWVSNQSFDDDPVSITIRIDGEVVVDDSFVGSQHNPMSFDIAGLSSGLHELVAESDTGARTDGSFTLPDSDGRYLVTDYWYDAGGEPDNRYFTLTESDEPVYFD